MKTLVTPSHIIVGMSGGVDSSVAAFLLKEAGHQVEGVFMKNWEGDDTETYCPATADMADAQAVCDKLGIDLTMVNFADQYWERVFAYFLTEYRAGRTPNPDILCNKEIKFRAFLDYAKQRGADFIATGHYVRANRTAMGIHLLKGLDPQKDQSYFLHALDQEQLAQSLFPVGIAATIGLDNHAKKDSTGICFIGERKFKTFLNEYLPAKPGQIETLEGEQIGTHDGLMFYTIGQRQGLHIGGKKGKSEAPWYVAGKDLARNVLMVVQGDNHPSLLKNALICGAIHWINAPPPLPLRATAKTRYRQSDQACLIEPCEPDTTSLQLDKIVNSHYRVTFDQPQRAITPGQSVVFYQDDICLGGGIIEE
jgi:tRNA-specific 2-thiouridylase